MMLLLAIDTSSRHGGAALADAAGSVLEARLWRSTANHTAQLLPAIADLLAAQGLDARALAGVAVALGPGRSARCAWASAPPRGWPWPAGSRSSALTHWRWKPGPHLTPDGIVAAWLDAGRNEVAAAWFDGQGARIKDDAIAPPGNAAARGTDAARRRLALLWRRGPRAPRRHQQRRQCRRRPAAPGRRRPVDAGRPAVAAGVRRRRPHRPGRNRRPGGIAALLPADAHHRRRPAAGPYAAGAPSAGRAAIMPHGQYRRIRQILWNELS